MSRLTASLIAVGALYTVLRPFRPWTSRDSWYSRDITRSDVGRESEPRAFVRCSASSFGPRYSGFDMNNTTPAAGSYTVCAKPAAS